MSLGQGQQIRSAAPHPNSLGCSPIVRNPMDSVPFRPTVEVIPAQTGALEKHTKSFRVQLASISGVAASPVPPVSAAGDRSGQSCVCSIGCPILAPDPRILPISASVTGTLIFASVLIALISLISVATYFAYGYPTSAAIPALYQLATVVGLVVLARTRRFGVFAPHSSSRS
jgi:mannose/fructose/N-acetylgalactosamine-specific phosphotransferase system component IID